MAPSTRGIQLPRSVPHRLCSQKHSCCHTLRGDIPGAMGDTSGPHASKAQSTRVGEMQERKPPRQQPEAPVLCSWSPARFPPPHWAAGMQAQVRGV